MDKLILVFYMNLRGQTPQQMHESMERFAKAMPLDDDIERIIIPVLDSDSRVECINPKLVSEEDYKEARQMLERAKEAMLGILEEASENKKG